MAVLIMVMISFESVPALAISLIEGSPALAVLISAGLAGGWLVRWLGLGREPWPERLIIGAGLGIGLLPLVVLGLGSAGLLTKPAAFALVGLLAIAGIIRLLLDLRELGVLASRPSCPATGLSNQTNNKQQTASDKQPATNNPQTLWPG